ncbi:MAG TPA: ribonuclease III, partial [Candidatus Dormibacteraeota bacterium]|nr:ribonuclease III [Candidatus Dormibacteraeota bacterium]
MGVHPGEGRLIAQAQTAPLAQSLQLLQQKIGIHFRDPGLLLEAVTHSSFANENPSVSPRDNERLEYLGDAVLQLIAAEYLYKHHPGATEGELTQTRSAMVNTNTLAQLAEELDLGSYLYLGKGIAKGGGRNLKSLLANAFEAVLGAVFLDAGYDAAYHYYLNRYRALPSPVRDENFKGRLQQVAQERFGATPVYDSEGARVGNRREYTSVVFAGSEPLGTGHGPTKQEAEQDAARAALQTLTGSAAAPKPARQTRQRRAPRK